jgi:hypothetical protein
VGVRVVWLGVGVGVGWGCPSPEVEERGPFWGGESGGGGAGSTRAGRSATGRRGPPPCPWAPLLPRPAKLLPRKHRAPRKHPPVPPFTCLGLRVQRYGGDPLVHQAARDALHQRAPEAAALPRGRDGDVPDGRAEDAVAGFFWGVLRGGVGDGGSRLGSGARRGRGGGRRAAEGCRTGAARAPRAGRLPARGVRHPAAPPPFAPPPGRQSTRLVARAKPRSCPIRATRLCLADRTHTTLWVFSSATRSREGSRRGKPTCARRDGRRGSAGSGCRVDAERARRGAAAGRRRAARMRRPVAPRPRPGERPPAPAAPRRNVHAPQAVKQAGRASRLFKQVVELSQLDAVRARNKLDAQRGKVAVGLADGRRRRHAAAGQALGPRDLAAADAVGCGAGRVAGVSCVADSHGAASKPRGSPWSAPLARSGRRAQRAPHAHLQLARPRPAPPAAAPWRCSVH